jgi:hypothetical protein
LLIVDDILWIAGMEKMKAALYTVEGGFAICGKPLETRPPALFRTIRRVCFRAVGNPLLPPLALLKYAPPLNED